MHLFSLNDDVLEAIIALVSPYDASQLAKTCRRGYAIAIPRMLTEVDFRPTSVPGIQRVRRFCAFILADSSYRASCLRVLKVTAKVLQDDHDAQAMGEVLRYAVNLKDLLFINNLHRHLQPCLADAIAQLPSLEVVRLTAEEASIRLLSKLASRPRSLQLLPPLGPSLWAPVDPQHLSRSLRRVELNGCILLAERLRSQCATFPFVHELMLSGNVRDPAALAYVFPNVHVVRQDGVSTAAPEPAASWPQLDHVELAQYPAVRMRCPARRLDLRFSADSAPASLARVLPFVEDAMPLVMLCIVGGPDVSVPVRALARVARRLKYLHMAVPTLDTAEFTRYLPAFKELSLAGLSLGYTDRMPFSTEEHWARALARKIAIGVPTLEYVGLNMAEVASMRHDNLECISWYRVVSRPSEGNVRMQRLARGEGAMVQQQLLDTPWS